MESESADDYDPGYSSESTAGRSFHDMTPYSEQGRESAISIMEPSSYQPPEGLSEPEDAIELPDHPGPQSEFLNAQSDVSLASSRSKLDPGIIDRVGFLIIITNIGAVILITVSVSVLSFLWFGGGDNKHWRRVMIDGWVSQAVTLSTLSIRLAVSVQAGTAVAMLASVSLESKSLGGILLPEAPALSIARYVNTGPLGSLLYFGKSSRWRLNVSTISILALAATTIVSQFTSTLLLWDVRPSVVPGFPREINTGIGFSMEHYIGGSFANTMSRAQNYWLAPPRSYPFFAEWASKPLNPLESIMDTGPSIRAFLPIDSESDRSGLLEFQGMASAFDARVTCFRPTIQDWSFIGPWTRGNYSDPNYGPEPISFNGTLFSPNITGDLSDVLHHDFSPAGYSFKFSIDKIRFTSDTNFMVRGLLRRAGGLLSTLNPMQNSTLNYSYLPWDTHPHVKTWFAQNKENGKIWEVELGHSFLIISAGPRGTVPIQGQSLLDLTQDEVSRDFKVEERGPWLDFSQDSDPDYQKGVMSVTLCFDALAHNRNIRVKGLQDFLVSAKRKSNYSEPKLGWDPDNTRFKTMAIRAQLNTLQPASDGTVFVLDPAYLNKTLRSFQWNPMHVAYEGDAGYSICWYYDNGTYHFNGTRSIVKEQNAPSETYDFLTAVVWRPLYFESSNNTFAIFVSCRDCEESSGSDAKDTVTTDMNPVLNAMFVDIMKETDNPALAWQSLVTTLMRMAYYDWLPTFDYMGKATVTSMVLCQMPQYHKGFILVMVNLLVHLVFVAVSSFLFFTRTRYSLLSNAWQAIAQVKAPETDLYLDKATMLDDKNVKGEIDRKSTRRRFNIRHNDEDGRVCLS